ncbi:MULTISPECIES: phosphate ABC transporter permease subunit PstC [Actinosynnema]|uniref:phosphate ABC transporter permease subunit PstC n=1 Tax=Actinosynnema TaxID=40566 RepID=UPI0020A3DDE9|nr:phosphate ABC transporter permease subunit PstC [Actinosynnema pretiosum]MCP2092320.1 phosphate ABC transporter membrane protein 1, PhoT family [Actinosynnema pretiosum]
MTAEVDRPRSTAPAIPLSDRVFRGVARTTGVLVLLVMGGIGAFLAYQAVPTLRVLGWSFFTENTWRPESNTLGILSVALGTVQVALVAITITIPVALGTALYITEYAPLRLKRTFVALLDLMAAVPSVVYGLWGFFFLQPEIIHLSRWLATHLGFLPFFRVDTDLDAAVWERTAYTSSTFICGVVVSMMVVPITASVMREVFSSAPQGEREAALALGSTRWGVIRSVVLPFGRGGIIGGTMLGLGRALGETIAVALIISPAFEVKFRLLEKGGNTISQLIALRFGESSPFQLSALLAAGLVLFLFTLLVNVLASIVVARSRSGAGAEI